MKRRALLFFIPVLLLARTATAEPSPFYIPPSQFNVVMEVMDMGFAHIFALFRNGTGSFTFDEGSKSLSNLRLAVDATSLTASTNENQHDLDNMLSTFQYPEIRVTMPDSVTFTDGKADLKTTVTLHGSSKPVTFSAVLNKSGKSPRAGGVWSKQGDAVGLSLTGELKRADFGLSDNPEMPGRFGDTLTLMIEFQAIGQ